MTHLATLKIEWISITRFSITMIPPCDHSWIVYSSYHFLIVCQGSFPCLFSSTW
jgi:hypothetical protein